MTFLQVGCMVKTKGWQWIYSPPTKKEKKKKQKKKKPYKQWSFPLENYQFEIINSSNTLVSETPFAIVEAFPVHKLLFSPNKNFIHHFVKTSIFIKKEKETNIYIYI